MVSALLSVRTLLLAIFMLMAGGGFLSTLIAIRLESAGYDAVVIGLVATSYFGGLTLGALRVSSVIMRVGHIRAFAAFVSIYSASSLAYAVVANPVVWVALRFADGFVMSGVFICLESWLNQRATSRNRSSVLAAYMVALYSGQAAGQFLLNTARNQPDLPFMLSAILLSLALVPVLLTRIEQPGLGVATPFSLGRLYRISPLGVVGVVSTGAMLGAFYALGAVFAQRLGLDLAHVALFTSCVIAGGVVLQWPLGILSDRYDRRRVIIACFLATTLVCSLLAFMATAGVGVFVLGAMFGGISFALYPLCVAHSNDHIADDERVGTSGGLILGYSLGAIAGPMLGSAGMASAGPGGLFLVIGSLAGFASVFGLGRALARANVPNADQGEFRTLPRTTPMAAALEDDQGGAEPLVH